MEILQMMKNLINKYLGIANHSQSVPIPILGFQDKSQAAANNWIPKTPRITEYL
jgi:hypothetical protein